MLHHERGVRHDPAVLVGGLVEPVHRDAARLVDFPQQPLDVAREAAPAVVAFDGGVGDAEREQLLGGLRFGDLHPA